MWQKWLRKTHVSDKKEKIMSRRATHGLIDFTGDGDEVFEKQKLWMTCCGFKLPAKE